MTHSSLFTFGLFYPAFFYHRMSIVHSNGHELMMMNSLSVFLSACPRFQNHTKTQKLSILKASHALTNSTPSPCCQDTRLTFTKNIYLPHKTQHRNSLKIQPLLLPNPPLFSKSKLSFTIIQLFTALPSFASDPMVSSSEQVYDKIDLEVIVVSIDNFFNRYPFFVAGCTFIWLVVIPLTQEYLSKCKYIPAIDAYRKLKDDPSAQLLDIRDGKSVKVLKSPNLTLLKKGAVHVEFSEGNEDGFIKKVMENFQDSASTVLCILDNFDGKSLDVAQLLYKTGFKEAYAIKGGVRGPKGWLAIQATLLPPSLHMYRRKKRKASKGAMVNGRVIQKAEDNFADAPPAIEHSDGPDGHRQNDNRHKVNYSESSAVGKISSVISSPYPNYPDLKPPSSPTPAKPEL